MTESASDRSPAIAAGIGLACFAFSLHTLNDTIIKWVSGTYQIHQIILIGSGAGFTFFATVVVATGSLGRMRTQRLGLHILRALVALAGGFGAYYAYSKLPLADAYALIFAGPLFVTALSVPVLREQVGWRRWSAVLVGFLGIVVMLRPGSSAFEPAALGAVLGALGYAVTVLMVRRLGLTESPFSYGIFGNLVSLIVTGALCVPFGFVMPPLGDLALMCGGAALAAFGFLCMVAAYRRAPAAIVAPFQYTQMLWGTLTGYVIWRHVPDTVTLIGAAIVAASGLYVLHRETRRRRPTTAPVPESAG
ncbi:MAG: DMT family transporter [Alphaproteobacteria bacterium]|nr:DMT family transporter [Alphaproteobacteria bacterium]